MMRKAVTLIFAGALVLAQSFAVLAHCGPHPSESGHVHHQAGSAAHSHSHEHGTDQGAHDHGHGHVHVSQHGSVPDGDFDGPFGDCALGSVGVETVCATVLSPLPTKGSQVEIRENALSAVTISLPTPPPDTRL